MHLLSIDGLGERPTRSPKELQFLAANSKPLENCTTWSWQKVTACAVTDVETLAILIGVDIDELKQITAINPFGLRIPHTFIRRMEQGVATDPLLLQLLNRSEEKVQHEDYSDDPLAEHTGNPCPGLIHKYQGRVLLTVATACPLNCRYCFRRHYPYDQNRLSPSTWHPALDYIKQSPDISEVILSGGEPLMLKDDLLDRLLEELQSIEHVKLLRIHTRFPIAIPQRLTPELVDVLCGTRIPLTLVLHTNHAKEIDETVIDALKPLRESSVTLLNQSVLLRNINDNVDALEALSRRLFEAGVLPYYLHVLDKVCGAEHFDVNDTQARQLVKQLTNRLPGYLLPTLVREIPHRGAKTRL